MKDAVQRVPKMEAENRPAKRRRKEESESEVSDTEQHVDMTDTVDKTVSSQNVPMSKRPRLHWSKRPRLSWSKRPHPISKPIVHIFYLISLVLTVQWSFK